jgi:hypothetical protein
MSRPLQIITAGALITLMSPSPATQAGPRPQAGAGPPAALVLTRIDELRRSDMTAAQANSFDLNKPGLVLTFGIRLPEDRRVVEAQEPARMRAVDSTGHDLTQIEANMFGRREHLELVRVWGEPPTTLKLTLAVPDRQATSFELSTTIDIVTDTGSLDAVVDVGTDWTKLDPELFAGQSVVARLRQGRRDLELDLKPGTVRAMIEKAEIIGPGEPLVSYSTGWSDLGLTYSFQGKREPGMKTKLTLRTGLRTMPVTIELDEQPLP